MRTAALVFDNFLSEDKWDYIQETVSNSDYLKTENFREWKDSRIICVIINITSKN